MDYNAYKTPIVMLRVDRLPATDLATRIVDFSYEDHLSKVDQAVITLADPGYELADDSRLTSDTQWDIRFGYVSQLSPVISLRLKYFEPTFAQDGVHYKKVTLHGRAADLLRFTQGRNWGRMTTADIASQIARRHGLSPVVDPSEDMTETPYVQPAVISDWEFLRTLADDIGFEFFVEAGKLFYRSRDTAYSQYPESALVYGAPGSRLLSFSPSIKATKVKNVQATGADTAKGKGVAHTADNQNVGGVHLGNSLPTARNPAAPREHATSGTDAIRRVKQAKADYGIGALLEKTREYTVDLESGKTSLTNVNTLGKPAEGAAASTVATTEKNATKAKRVAKAVKRNFLDLAVTADGNLIGSPDVFAKRTYMIVVPERRLSGLWYCKEVTHRITGGTYTTGVKFHRGAFTGGKQKNNRKTADSANKKPVGAAAGRPKGGLGGINDIGKYTINAETGAVRKAK